MLVQQVMPTDIRSYNIGVREADDYSMCCMLQVHETNPRKPATVCWILIVTRLASCSHVATGGAYDNRQCEPTKPIPVYRRKLPLQLWVSGIWWHCHCFQNRSPTLYCSLPGCRHRQLLPASNGLGDLQQSQSPKTHMICLCV